MAEKTKNSNKKEKQTNEKTYYPTNDYLFKRIFGYKGNEKITEDLIETILGRKCEVIEIKSDEVTEKDLQKDKIGVLDVFVKEKDGTQINIEMQVAEYKYIIDRILYYWAKKYIESLQGGDDYEELKPTKVILITNFEIKKLKVLEDIVNSFKIIDTKTGKLILTENLELVIIELPKMKKYQLENKELESWLKFIVNPNSLGAKDMNENKYIKEAKEEYDKVLADEHERDLIAQRERYWLDYNSMRNAMKEEGFEEGREEGLEAGRKEGMKEGMKKKQIEIAKKMIEKDLAVEEIIELTGLTKEEIEMLRK